MPSTTTETIKDQTIFFLSFFRLNIKFNINKITTMSIILAETKVNNNPLKNNPVFATANDNTSPTNNPTKTKQQNNNPINAKNLIPRIKILKIPLINLYSECALNLTTFSFLL